MASTGATLNPPPTASSSSRLSYCFLSFLYGLTHLRHRSPAGGTFQVEMAENKVCTTMSDVLSPDQLGNFGDCNSYDIATYGNFPNGSCITSPNLHARNKSDAAGSAFAISYTVSYPPSSTVNSAN
jgi:hypothetical protein